MAKLSRDENYAPRRLFIFLGFLLTFMNGISFLGTIYWIVNGIEFDPLVAGIFVIIFLGYLIGMIGIFKPLPPLHYGVLIASAINLVVSIILILSGNDEGYLQGLASFLILYLGLRFPLNLAQGQISYDTERWLR